MKSAIIAILVASTSAIRISTDPPATPSPNLPSYPIAGAPFPEGSVNNMNYEGKFNAPPPAVDDRLCQEKVGLAGELDKRTLRNCKKDIAGHPINPGKI